MHIDAEASDSWPVPAGTIPGLAGCGAFTVTGPRPSAIPVVIAVPHAGRCYPASLIERMRNPRFAAMRLEDRYVDLLARDVARRTGAVLLVADAPRAMIDLNRAPDDVDWDMFGRRADPPGEGQGVQGRSRSGLGLIPRRLPGMGELWKGRHELCELEWRLAQVHEPYHACLSKTLAELRIRWGAALLIDLHSMPPLPSRPAHAAAQVVLGDRFGASCDGRLIAEAFAHLSERGRTTAYNRPYAGGYVLERHSAPLAGIHAMQIEIDRRLYLDSRLEEPGPGLAETADTLTGLLCRLAGEVAAIGRSDSRKSWVQAAE